MILIPNNIDYNFFNKITHINKQYISEVILITNTDNQTNLTNWIYWHLYVIGFDHLVIINNNSPLNITAIANDIHKTKIKVINKPGKISQSQIYTELVNSSNALWVLPIDDDEYLWIDPEKYSHSINSLLLQNTDKPYIKYGFTWRYMFSKNLYSYANYSMPYILTYTYSYNTNNDDLPSYDWYCHKSIVNTNYKHLYDEVNDLSTAKLYPLTYIMNKKDISNRFTTPCVMGTVHNPITFFNNKYYHTYNFASNTLEASYYTLTKKLNLDDICLLHFKYRTYEEWYKKTVNNKTSRFTDLPDEYFKTISNPETIKTIYDNNMHFKEFTAPAELFTKLL